MAQLPQTVAECHAVIALLMERVKVLEERVNLDSNNSSKPPSSNGPGQMNRAQRRGSERKRGAQPGHKGHARAMLDESEGMCSRGMPRTRVGAPLTLPNHLRLRL